jgi:hypothetical protein
VTLEYGLFFLSCNEWCTFPFTQCSVDIILSSSIKPKKMIEIWLKITFIFIHGHDFQSGTKSLSDECKNNGNPIYTSIVVPIRGVA